MATFEINQKFHPARGDETAIRLRKRGFTAYVESTECGRQFYLVTDASRAAVLLEAGHGQFLRMDNGFSTMRQI